MELVYQRVTKMTGDWSISLLRKGWESWAGSALRQLRGSLINVSWVSEERMSEVGPGSPPSCQAIGQEAMGKNWCTENSAWIWRRTFLCRWQSTGTNCLSWRLWSVLHWRYSRTIWTQSCIMCCRITLLAQRGWTRWSIVVLSNLIYSVISVILLIKIHFWKFCVTLS